MPSLCYQVTFSLSPKTINQLHKFIFIRLYSGGGIGPELMQHVRQIFGIIGVPVDFEIIDINPSSEGNDDLDYAITSIKRNGVAIKGL